MERNQRESEANMWGIERNQTEMKQLYKEFEGMGANYVGNEQDFGELGAIIWGIKTDSRELREIIHGVKRN